MKNTLLALLVILPSMLYCAEAAHPALKIKIPTRVDQLRMEAAQNPEKSLFPHGQKKEKSPRHSIVELQEPQTPESFSSADTSPLEKKRSPQYSPVKFVPMREPETPGTSSTITLFDVELQYRLQPTGAPKIVLNPGTFSSDLNAVYLHDQGKNSTYNKRFDTLKREASKEFLQDPNNRMIIFAAAMLKQIDSEKGRKPLNKSLLQGIKTDLEVCELNILVDKKVQPKDTLKDLITLCDEVSVSKPVEHDRLKQLYTRYYKPAEILFRAAGMQFGCE